MLRSVPHALRLNAAIEPFPASHLRTNAFLVRHRDFVALDGFAVATKLQAHAVESGRASMTRQLEARGLRAVVVDRVGNIHDAEAGPASETFWQGRQQGLIVADNQTELFSRRTPIPGSRCRASHGVRSERAEGEAAYERGARRG